MVHAVAREIFNLMAGDSDGIGGGEETPPQAPTPSGPSFTPSGSGPSYRQVRVGLGLG